MMQNRNYKRQTRQLKDSTKQLISQKLKGRSKPINVRAKIASSMKSYWDTVKDSDESI